MRRIATALQLATAILTSAMACAGAVEAQAMRDMSILTGADGGTYHRFGRDIATVLKKVCRADLDVRPSQGSLENLDRLQNEPFAQLAIVQQDVLDYVLLNKGRSPTVKKYVDSFRYVLPLYREEVHIVIRRGAGIATLADLAGKSVAVGETGSGTNLTATVLLINTGLSRRLKAVLEIGPREGILRLLGLEAGAPVDAVFYVAGQPVPLLSGADPRITPDRLGQLSLVAIPKSPVPRLYAAARFTPETYNWLDRPVDTISVRAVLITYNYKGGQCDNVAMTERLIKDQLEELQRFGHPKWHHVNIDAAVDGCQRYACVEKRQSTPIDACRFVADGDRPGGPAVDCREACDARELKRNALRCLLCRDKAALQSE